MSNNPPFCSLDLTQEEAEFLLKNCNANLQIGLKLMMAMQDRKSLVKLVNHNEKFKSIRAKLLIQGVKENDDA